MAGLLWIIPALPLAGFVILALGGARMSRFQAALVGAGSVGLSAALTILTGILFISGLQQSTSFNETLWTWINIPGLKVDMAFHLDALSLVFIFVITFVGFLIHLYSSAFMAEEEGYSRFFAYMNLFVASMLVLVLSDNLLMLYLGWEGVGLCSYLLIGFWYKDPANGYAARKAFIVTRVGDTAMLIGLLLLYTSFHTLNISEILSAAPSQWAMGSGLATAAALLLLGGAVGKSAQLPLQTWLPDAMAGPTPVSALIHAATMVTAGVYLIARTNVLFSLAPHVRSLVAIIGAITLLLAGFSAITQKDIKKVLAYSTISQIGYMFLALGVGAWSAAVFHFMIHAFFKALLFLGAGVIILGLNHEHDMFKMGGLRKALPLTFWTFLIGAASLSALPLITAGFYSKDLILYRAMTGPNGNVWLWAAGLAGALLTAIYTFRMVFLTFYGKMKSKPDIKPSYLMSIPLIILAVLSIAGGWVELPRTLGNFHLFSGFLHTVLPASSPETASIGTEGLLQTVSAIVALAGVAIAWYHYLKKASMEGTVNKPLVGNRLFQFWFSGWGFDWFYNLIFVRPVVFLSQIDVNDFIDRFYTGITNLTAFLHRRLSFSQNGRLRWYMAGIVLGALLSFTLMILL